MRNDKHAALADTTSLLAEQIGATQLRELTDAELALVSGGEGLYKSARSL